MPSKNTPLYDELDCQAEVSDANEILKQLVTADLPIVADIEDLFIERLLVQKLGADNVKKFEKDSQT